MNKQCDEIASYLARVRMLLQARAEVRPSADLISRGDLERVQACIMRSADVLHAEIRRNEITAAAIAARTACRRGRV
jgi:hypothetical protein